MEFLRGYRQKATRTVHKADDECKEADILLEVDMRELKNDNLAKKQKSLMDKLPALEELEAEIRLSVGEEGETLERQDTIREEMKAHLQSLNYAVVLARVKSTIEKIGQRLTNGQPPAVISQQLGASALNNTAPPTTDYVGTTTSSETIDNTDGSKRFNDVGANAERAAPSLMEKLEHFLNTAYNDEEMGLSDVHRRKSIRYRNDLLEEIPERTNTAMRIESIHQSARQYRQRNSSEGSNGSTRIVIEDRFFSRVAAMERTQEATGKALKELNKFVNEKDANDARRLSAIEAAITKIANSIATQQDQHPHSGFPNSKRVDGIDREDTAPAGAYPGRRMHHSNVQHGRFAASQGRPYESQREEFHGGQNQAHPEEYQYPQHRGPHPGQETPAGTTASIVHSIMAMIQPFGGEEHQFPLFMAQFDDMVHDNVAIPVKSKLTMLIRLLPKEISEQHCPHEFTERAYWNLREDLERQFCRSSTQKKALLRKIDELDFSSENYDVLSKSINTFATYAGKLKSFGVNPNDPFLQESLIKRLPKQLRSAAHKRTSEGNPTLRELINAIHDTIELKKSIEDSESSTKEIYNTQVNHVRRTDNPQLAQRWEGRGASSSYQPRMRQEKKVKFVPPGKAMPCTYCDATDHCANECTLPVEKKLKAVTNKMLCFNCLSNQHGVIDCKSRFNCLNCYKRHYTAHCPQIKDKEKIRIMVTEIVDYEDDEELERQLFHGEEARTSDF